MEEKEEEEGMRKGMENRVRNESAGGQVFSRQK